MMNICEIPCNGDGTKIRMLDSEVTGVRVYVDSPCYCPICANDDTNIEFIEEYRERGDQEDECFEERLSDCCE